MLALSPTHHVTFTPGLGGSKEIFWETLCGGIESTGLGFLEVMAKTPEWKGNKHLLPHVT